MTGDALAAAGFELRFDLAGRAAVRIAGGPVAARHVEPVPPAAPWRAEARCGTAVGWLLAGAAPPDPERVQAQLALVVAEEAALALQARAAQAARYGAELLERLTHRLRTDVTTLSAVADAALAGLFTGDELAEVPAEVARTVAEAQRRLTAAREVMTVLDGSRAGAEPVVETLRAELEAAGRDATVDALVDEQPLAWVAGGWGACARALAADARFGRFAVLPDRGGWRVEAGTLGEPVAFTQKTVGNVVQAGQLVVAAGGTAAAHAGPGVALILPAAPPSG